MRKVALEPSTSSNCPPWASIARLEIASPRPVPLVLVVKNGAKILCGGLTEMPGPLSEISIHTVSPTDPNSISGRGPEPDPGLESFSGVIGFSPWASESEGGEAA